MTGYAVCPGNTLIKDKTRGKIIYQEGGERGKKELTKGALHISLPSGSYDYVFEAADYRSVTTNFTINHQSPRRIDIYLDPLETPPELNPELITSLHRPDSTVIVGFVVDDATGMPLVGVRIKQGDGNVYTKTDARGFFIMNIPVPLWQCIVLTPM